MYKYNRYLLALMAASAALLPLNAREAADYVNTIIGTNGMGHTFPGACTPFGLIQLSPDTDTIPHNVDGKYQAKAYDYCAGYQYSDPTIVGFSHTHLSGTGHSDLGDILIMPGTGEPKFRPGRSTNPDEGYRQRYDHATEKTAPGYYEVTLGDNGVKVQLTAAPHTGVHRYTYPAGEKGHLILDLNHGIYNYDGKVLWSNLRVENDTLLTGYRITNGWARTNYTYFAISFSQPIVEYGHRDLEPVRYNGFWRRFRLEKNFPEITGRKIVAYFDFDTETNPELTVKVALSAVSTEGALRNLRAETSGQSFESIAARARQEWNRELSCIEIDGSDDEKTMFYTSLYHTMINPSVYMDVDGRYRGIDHNIHQADGFTNYSIFSLWDTYRAEHPFLNLMKPDRNRDMVKSMVRHSEESVHGMLPVWSLMGNENWCMSGYHAVSAVADAFVKGVVTDGQADLLAAMERTANVPYYEGIEEYVNLGYIPLEKSGTAASTTLEYAYDDFAIYRAALKAGDTAMAEKYRKRAMNYRNLYGHPTGFACPRLADGSFKRDFDPLQTYGEGFIEGNSWNFSFHVPQDVKGLISVMGGEKVFIDNLDRLFSMHLPEKYFEHNEDITEDCLVGGYVHGNEPSHHIPYLYAWTGQPWKTQYWLREIINKMYRNDINGLGGNDDCGQMSAWYVFSVLGFYPVCPATDQYVLGAPYVSHAVINLPNGKTLEIKAPGVSDKNRYVKSLRIDGVEYPGMYVTHDDILRGGVWEFTMSSAPNKKRGVKADTKPYSLSDNESI
ncbi:MAG: GH92 family glycosyl hydrolase [Clostridium sp.]|nr:GH92 family glycosyl hydrolase [Clostridium sp.]